MIMHIPLGVVFVSLLLLSAMALPSSSRHSVSSRGHVGPVKRGKLSKGAPSKSKSSKSKRNGKKVRP